MPLSQLEAAGEQEVLNWFCLVGAMDELGYQAQILDLQRAQVHGGVQARHPRLDTPLTGYLYSKQQLNIKGSEGA
ncbi:MAG: hypothetical protein EXR54_05985 [Dehalococcoidia bacterium]|nr:hypothetical protein [Dehalococcoidia bacterium]MSQ17105.1 hypothetical protein [Dehalococcoidia bacterium]